MHKNGLLEKRKALSAAHLNQNALQTNEGMITDFRWFPSEMIPDKANEAVGHKAK